MAYVNMKGCVLSLLTFILFLDFSFEEEANWFENLPAVAMDYKVHIDPGKEDCYFQYVNPGATFYASFQVSLMTSFIISTLFTAPNHSCSCHKIC